MRILILGDLMLDVILNGEATRLSPEAPVPIILNAHRGYSPGGAANVALNCASLGAEVWVAGAVGRDEAAERLMHALGDRGVNTELVQKVCGPTTEKLRIKAGGQQLVRLDTEKALCVSDARLVWELAVEQDAKSPFDAIVISDYAKGMCVEQVVNVELFSSSCRRVIVDPKGQNFSKYSGALVITPNKSEYEMVFGKWSEAAFRRNADAILSEWRIRNLCVTLGAKGFHSSGLNGDFAEPSYAAEVYDVTGAGDSFVAGFAVALSSGIEYSECLRKANQAAGIAVRYRGTHQVTAQEFHDTYGEWLCG